MCFTYALQYYDKSVLSQAAIFGMKADLGLDEGLRYSNTSLIFYCGFIVGAYPVRIKISRGIYHSILIFRARQPFLPRDFLPPKSARSSASSGRASSSVLPHAGPIQVLWQTASSSD